jgi:hypothetical protein
VSNITEPAVKHNDVPKILTPPPPIISKSAKIEEVVKKPIKNKKPFNATKTYLNAKIKSVSPYGLILVKFSETMQKVLANNISKIFN